VSNGRIRVAVLGGGRSSEHEVSLASAAGIAAALDSDRYDVVTVTIGRDGTWSSSDGRLAAAAPFEAMRALAGVDVVFPALHGVGGEDGTVAGLLDVLGVPYVGSGVRAGAIGMDKWATKLLAEAIGIPTAPGLLLAAGDDVARVRLSPPLIVKPATGGSSHGVTVVHTREELPTALAAARAHGERVLVEQLLQGREIDIAVLELPDGGRRVGPPLEITPRPGTLHFDTTTKYDGGAMFTVPCSLPGRVGRQLESAATSLFDALGCRGLIRADFFLTDAGLVLNEVNTMPGMTEHSQVPRMFAAQELDYPALADLLVRTALRKPAQV
jgi:D-alanine-D-alanine ligase